MLVTQVSFQVPQLGAVEVTQLTLVGPEVIVLRHVQTQAFCAAARESAFVAVEHDALEVARQMRATRLDEDDALLCNDKVKNNVSGEVVLVG